MFAGAHPRAPASKELSRSVTQRTLPVIAPSTSSGPISEPSLWIGPSTRILWAPMTSGLEEFGIVDDEAPIAKSKELTAGKLVTSSADRMSPAAIKKALQEIPLFSGLLPTHLDRIAKLAREFEYTKNEYVFSHGDDGDGLYLVVSGAIRISRNMGGMGVCHFGGRTRTRCANEWIVTQRTR